MARGGVPMFDSGAGWHENAIFRGYHIDQPMFSGNTAAVFSSAVSTVLRLSLLLAGSAAVLGFNVLLAHVMACLVHMEGLHISPTSMNLVLIGDGSVLYGAHKVHKPFLPAEDPLRIWVWCAESLWLAVLSQGVGDVGWVEQSVPGWRGFGDGCGGRVRRVDAGGLPSPWSRMGVIRR